MLDSKFDQNNHADLAHSIEDSKINSVQSSTRALIETFRDKTKLLTNCSDLKLLLREGYDVNLAGQIAQKFFGETKVSFVAIDGTEGCCRNVIAICLFVLGLK